MDNGLDKRVYSTRYKFAISVLVFFTSNAKIMNWKALKELLGYIDVGIKFGGCYIEYNKLLTYADSDFAPSYTKRKSH